MHLSMLASLISAFDFFDYAHWAVFPVVYDMSVASSSPVKGRGRNTTPLEKLINMDVKF